MKFLHTADLHIKKGEEKRMEVLKWLIARAEELKVNYFIIAGDLFDSDTDATVLRPGLKKIFEGTKIRFLIIPGNHDIKSFSRDYDYGKNVIQLIQTPFETIELDGIKICGIPYQNKKFSECTKELPRGIDILIAHGTVYDESFIFSMLEDEETEYMPIYPQNLENIARYVALGHLHARRIEREYKNTKIIYPGSPLALDTKCTEQRVFVYIEINKDKLAIKPVEVKISPYWQKAEFFVFPGNEDKVLEKIRNYLTDVNKKNIMPHIIVKGFVEIGDKDFVDSIKEIKKFSGKEFPDFEIAAENIQSWDKVIQNQIARRFVEKTSGLDDELRMKIFEISFPIFNEAIK